MSVERADIEQNVYWVPVDEELQNNVHTYSLGMVGHNKQVLELGPAAGHVTRALVQRGCTVVGIEIDPVAAAALDDVAECHVGDLDDPAVIGEVAGDRRFDVVLAGDVLEHLRHPLKALRACRKVLAPGGYVVLSVPNIAHADVAMVLARGRFPYHDWGLLDRTHVHFFTLDSLREMIRDAGFLMVDLERVIYPVFTTELGVDAGDFEGTFVEALLANPEAETYQFICRVVPHSGEVELERLAERAIEANERARRMHADRLLALAEIEQLRTACCAATAERDMLMAELDVARGEANGWFDVAHEKHLQLEALERTKSMRLLRGPRRAYGRLRRIAS